MLKKYYTQAEKNKMYQQQYDMKVRALKKQAAKQKQWGSGGFKQKPKKIKDRGLLNPFSQDTKELFLYNYNCWECGKSSEGLSGHHILKRVSNSPLNLAPLCPACHAKGDIHWFSKRSKYLKKTLNYLKTIKYKLTNKDKLFLEKYKMYYENHT